MKEIFFDIFKMLIVFLSLWIWLFVGVQRIERESDTNYVFFIKKHMTFRFFFVNGTHCGECELIDFDILNQDEVIDFNNLCLYRYDLQPAKYCYEYLYETPNTPEKEKLYKENVFFRFIWDD